MKKVLPTTYKLSTSKIALQTPENLVSDLQDPGNPSWELLTCTKAETRRNALKTPDLDAKPQVWHYQPKHFESTKKVTQLIEQVNEL